MHNRREFLRDITWASCVLTLPAFGAQGGWKNTLKEAFMVAGFDPDAKGNTTFVICGDVHEPEYSEHLPEQIQEWNAMKPAPCFISLLGDNICSASRSFGSMPKNFDRARTEMKGLHEKLRKLNPDISLKLVIGNHDSYPGEVDAKLFRSVKDGFSAQPVPNEKKKTRSIPLPFDGRGDVLWSLLIGQDKKETDTAFVSGKGGDCGTWWFYVKELVFRLPLKQKAQGAEHFAVLAAMSKHRKTGELPKVYASGDGEAWIESKLLDNRESVNRCAIPENLRKSNELFVKVESFGYGADTCVGGFALCK